jgi:DNA topoisomerase-1
MPVVVVESPAKAKTINSYLGKDYTVLASFGHVRDLPAKDGSVDPDQGFAMEWEVAADSKKHLKAIADALKDDPNLILATDPDREGEAISWHLTEALRDRKAIKASTQVSRVTFNAITKAAVAEAMKHPRQVDVPLVDAYLARRALDYLVGFNLSPVLWRKLPGAKSAGRVQSVCLRLIVEREMEIEAFRAQEYWTVEALLKTPRGKEFTARLVTHAGKKLDKFDLPNQAAAELAVAAIQHRDLSVTSVEAKPASRHPSAPFMTSTLQQEASRKFGFGAKATMSAAQRLYEAGHITYMRTDGIDMAPEAVMAARDAIKDRFGAEYLPKSPRMYKNKAKNAQEAHECIRPTDMTRDAASLRITDADQRKLYDLIWKRTLASQMAEARLERTTVEIGSQDGQVGLRATGQVVLFDGFMAVYTEGRDDPAPGASDAEDDDARLPQVAQGDALQKQAVTPEQHFTQPPPRYTEATLVKRMEELGIGRPSTYASIVTTIQDREYVRKENNRLYPEDKGRLVTIFLTSYFRRYVEYDFTAGLENQLDHISAGEADYKDVLAQFWRDFSAAIAETAELRIGEVLDKIDEVLSPHLYPLRADGTDPRLCPTCGKGRLSMRTARTGGAFIGCSNYPDCRFTRPFGPPSEDGAAQGGERLLGHDNGDPIHLKDGRFGPYVQRGEATAEIPKPPRASLPKGWDAASMDMEKALRLLALPRFVGTHPEDGEPVEAGIGRYGPFVKHGATYANLPDVAEVFEIGMNRAMEVLAQKAAGRGAGRGRAAAEPTKALGEHPDGGAVAVMPGRFGPYVRWGKVNATLPKGTEPETITLDEAVALVNAKAGTKPARKTAAKAKAEPKSAKTKAATKPKTPAKAKVPSKAKAKAPARKAAPKDKVAVEDVVEE